MDTRACPGAGRGRHAQIDQAELGVDEVEVIMQAFTGSGAQEDLPVAPTDYDLFLNLKTAKTLGITFPPSILAQAKEVIE